jgi:hypothetical protein
VGSIAAAIFEQNLPVGHQDIRGDQVDRTHAHDPKRGPHMAPIGSAGMGAVELRREKSLERPQVGSPFMKGERRFIGDQIFAHGMFFSLVHVRRWWAEMRVTGG